MSSNPFSSEPTKPAADPAAAPTAAAPPPAAAAPPPPPQVPVLQNQAYPAPPGGYAAYPPPPPGAGGAAPYPSTYPPGAFPGAHPPQGGAGAFPRQWSNHLCACFGSCSNPLTDIGVCCAGTWCTPCLLGYVNWRGLGVTTTAAALLGGAYFLLLWGSGLSNSSAEAGIIDPAVACDDGTGPCPAAIGGWAYALLALSIVLSAAAACLAARHRRQLRERHGLPGTPATDFFLWWCCAPCESCREARTILYAPVNGGVWGAPPGALPPPPPPATEPPKPQEMAKLEGDAKV